MGAGFPDGTPLRHVLYFIYNHVAAVRFLRASYKGAPLLAVALAVLAGVAAGALWARLGLGGRPGGAGGGVRLRPPLANGPGPPPGPPGLLSPDPGGLAAGRRRSGPPAPRQLA